MPTTMKAAVIREAGGPDVFKIESLPVPVPTDDEVLIEVKAFGLNRSELFTRQGHSSNVMFPRVLGIEAVGVVAHAPGGQFSNGDVVATCMGGLGREFDGGYAEFTCVPAKQVQKFETALAWEVLGALPEMLQTAWGSLFKSLQLKKSDRFSFAEERPRLALLPLQLQNGMVPAWRPRRETLNERVYCAKTEWIRSLLTLDKSPIKCMRFSPPASTRFWNLSVPRLCWTLCSVRNRTVLSA